MRFKYGTNDVGETRNFDEKMPARLIKTPSKNPNFSSA